MCLDAVLGSDQEGLIVVVDSDEKFQGSEQGVELNEGLNESN